MVDQAEVDRVDGRLKAEEEANPVEEVPVPEEAKPAETKEKPAEEAIGELKVMGKIDLDATKPKKSRRKRSLLLKKRATNQPLRLQKNLLVVPNFKSKRQRRRKKLNQRTLSQKTQNIKLNTLKSTVQNLLDRKSSFRLKSLKHPKRSGRE